MEYSNYQDPPARPGPKSRLPELVLDWEPVVVRGRAYASAQHQIRAIYTAGQISEIVDVIFSFASRSCLYNFALVCKSYYDIAIKYLWRRLPSALPILRLLGNIQLSGRYMRTWAFATTPSQSSWENFHKFARYVGVIAPRTPSWSRGTLDVIYDDSAKGEDVDEGDRCSKRCCGSFHIRQAALDQIVQHQCSAGGALPPHKAFVPFLGPKLKTIILFYHGCGWSIDDFDDAVLLQRLIQQEVQELADFDGEIPVERVEVSVQKNEYFALHYEEIDEAFLLVLKRYTKLRRVKAPMFMRHDDLVSGLRHLRHLQSLSVTFENPEALMSFVSIFAPEHSDIRHLELEYRQADVATPRSILHPLLHCHGLISLSIATYSGRSPTRLSSWPLPNLYGMSEAWPKLESLTLCPHSVIPLEDLEAFQDTGLFLTSRV